MRTSTRIGLFVGAHAAMISASLLLAFANRVASDAVITNEDALSVIALSTTALGGPGDNGLHGQTDVATAMVRVAPAVLPMGRDRAVDAKKQ